jgi:hypothetical protein
MKLNCTAGRRAAALAILLLLSGCGRGTPPRVYPDKPDANAPQRAIELYDANKDGFLDAKELDKAPGLQAAMQQIDTKRQGKISAADISARLQAWADSKVGRMSLSYVVLHNGVPLEGATVKFVPEKFLGGEIKTAEGVTDSRGYAAISCGGKRGICPGFYRVEVTKDGEKIPAKFNAETQLGQEAAIDAAGLLYGAVKVNLTY